MKEDNCCSYYLNLDLLQQYGKDYQSYQNRVKHYITLVKKREAL